MNFKRKEGLPWAVLQETTENSGSWGSSRSKTNNTSLFLNRRTLYFLFFEPRKEARGSCGSFQESVCFLWKRRENTPTGSFLTTFLFLKQNPIVRFWNRTSRRRIPRTASETHRFRWRTAQRTALLFWNRTTNSITTNHFLFTELPTTELPTTN